MLLIHIIIRIIILKKNYLGGRSFCRTHELFEPSNASRWDNYGLSPPKLITNVENLEESVKVNDQNHKLQIQIILLNKLANILMEILLLGWSQNSQNMQAPHFKLKHYPYLSWVFTLNNTQNDIRWHCMYDWRSFSCIIQPVWS